MMQGVDHREWARGARRTRRRRAWGGNENTPTLWIPNLPPLVHRPGYAYRWDPFQKIEAHGHGLREKKL